MDNTKRPSDLLGGLLSKVKADAACADTTRALTKALGSPTSDHCHVASERHGRLLVDVDSAPLFAELQSFRRDEVKEQVNKFLGSKRFAEVRFRLMGEAHA